MKVARKVAGCMLAASVGGGFGILSVPHHHHHRPVVVAIECRSARFGGELHAECKAIVRYNGVLVYMNGNGERP